MGKVSTEARSLHRKLIPDMSHRISMSQLPCVLLPAGRELATVLPCADARATEEPDAGKLYVRVCTGAPGNRRPYRGALNPFCKSLLDSRSYMSDTFFYD